VLPAKDDSEHPGAPSSPYRGADFTHQVLEALTANPEVWGKTIFFLTFDENDGLFDHLPAPAVPSYDTKGRLAGKSTLDLEGMYFDAGPPPPKNDTDKGKKGDEEARSDYLDERDTISGRIRPWGFGPRVPLYIISPWSKGGWVHSEVADHTSVGQFIEKRFGVHIPAISPWHRSISSDLVSAFDFVNPNDPHFPEMPDTSDYAAKDEASKKLPTASPPEQPNPLFQEKGTRYSRALPYRLNVGFGFAGVGGIGLEFENAGSAGVVFHVYDLNRLEQIPKRYTVEAGKNLSDVWQRVGGNGAYDLEVYGPNGFFRKFKGNTSSDHLLSRVTYNEKRGKINIDVLNQSRTLINAKIRSNAYDYPSVDIKDLKPSEIFSRSWKLKNSGNWYDFTLQAGEDFLHRYAGRMETGEDSISDPAMAAELDHSG